MRETLAPFLTVALVFIASPTLAQPGSDARVARPVIAVTVDFPFASYVERVQARIAEHWKGQTREGVEPELVFDIGADGVLRLIAVGKSSGDTAYDEAALRAVRQAAPFPPLPEESKEPFIRAHLDFKFSPQGGARVTAITGHASVRRRRVDRLRINDDVLLLDRIMTGDQSSVTLVLAGKVTFTMHERTVLELMETPGRVAIDVILGRVDVAMAREQIQPGETFDVQTPNGILTVSGGRALVFVVIDATRICAIDGTFAFQSVAGARDEVRASQCITIPTRR